MTSNIKIAILDDHLIFLAAIALLIKNIYPSCRVKRYSSPIEILQDVEEGAVFDLILCDLIMNSMNGLAFIGALRSYSKSIPVIVLSGINTSPPIEDIKRLGGNGFVHKSAQNDDFKTAIDIVLSGGYYFQDIEKVGVSEQPTKSEILEAIRLDGTELPALAPRQIEVLRLIADGHTNKEIAETLFISENTVKTHLKMIFRELGVNKRTACVRKAQSMGLI